MKWGLLGLFIAGFAGWGCESDTIGLSKPDASPDEDAALVRGDGGVTCGLEADDEELLVTGLTTYAGLNSVESVPVTALRSFTYGNDGCWRELRVTERPEGGFAVMAPRRGAPVYLLLDDAPVRYAVVFGRQADISEVRPRSRTSGETGPADSLSLTISGFSQLRWNDYVEVVSFSGGISQKAGLGLLREFGYTDAPNSSRAIELAVDLRNGSDGRRVSRLSNDSLYVTQKVVLAREVRTTRFGEIGISTTRGQSRHEVNVEAVQSYTEFPVRVDVAGFDEALPPGTGVQNPTKTDYPQIWVSIYGYPSDSMALAMARPVASEMGSGVGLGAIWNLTQRDDRLTVRVAEVSPPLPVRVAAAENFYVQKPVRAGVADLYLTSYVSQYDWARPGLQLTPAVAAPGGVRVDDRDELTDLLAVGTTPQLSWTTRTEDPSVRHRLVLFDVKGVTGRPTKKVAEFVSERPGFRLPPGIMDASSAYVAQVGTETTQGGLLSTALPFGVATTATGVFTP